MQHASEHLISGPNTGSPIIADRPVSIEARPLRPKAFFPILLLMLFAALGFFLAWLLDSSSVLLGQKPDRTTQILMVLMCIGPAGALVIFRVFKPEGTIH